MNTAIAQHLNVTESAILEVQEWARVLWVRVKGLGARFVSKKVVKMEMTKDEARQYVINEFAKQGIQCDGAFAVIPNVTAYNPAAKREITGDAEICIHYKNRVMIQGSNSRGEVVAQNWKHLEQIKICDFVGTKGHGIFGAADEESF